MDHLTVLREIAERHDDDLTASVVRATGRYYTHPVIGRLLSRVLGEKIDELVPLGGSVTVADPFGGDGRLPVWLIEHVRRIGRPDISWKVHLWDLHNDGLERARKTCLDNSRSGVPVELHCVEGDSFREAMTQAGQFDVVVTNPPWELLKPDRRELKRLSGVDRHAYVTAMRAYDEFLSTTLPLSQPERKFAGWGTNLARVGAELAMRLVRPGGLMGLVSPASLLADDMSVNLRRWLLCENTLLEAAYFPAELRLFEGADVSTAALVLRRAPSDIVSPRVSVYEPESKEPTVERVTIPATFLEENRHVVPISFGAHGIDALVRFAGLPKFGDLEASGTTPLWAGREIDETQIAQWLGPEGDGQFVKGRMIDRFRVVEAPSQFVKKEGWVPTDSVQYSRIVWRDVSRPNQRRRIKATIIPAGWIAGNSLGVAYFRDGDESRTCALLGIMSSFPFEFQLRSFLATGHVSLGALRKVRIPELERSRTVGLLAEAVQRAINGEANAETEAEALAARLYGLSRSQLAEIMEHFPKVTKTERESILEAFDRTPPDQAAPRADATRKTRDASRNAATIPNHRTAKLSELDMQVAVAVPPGGNWKDVPETVPSKRLETIRSSYARGEGSRSTYYGRLRRDRPAYTINTYFSRPGNGCHLHYDYEGGQHRVLSQREAARLQSFPDSFVFRGSQASVNKQIGNAVPPLLAFQIARTLGEPGYFVDLFAGAGGLGLGFTWAGWTPVVANEIEPSFLQTYTSNVHREAVLGDITREEVLQEIVDRAVSGIPDRAAPLWVLGGPPCQGFSTAGKARSMDDARNHLFWYYRALLDRLRPDGFVFENVTGLLNMENGETFRQVRQVLSETCEGVAHWVLSADEHAIPQRRKRVFIIGHRDGRLPSHPERLTSVDARGDLFGGTRPAISVEEALGDLPPLRQGEDGSGLDYVSEPLTPYQALMRGFITPEDYLLEIRSTD